MTTPTRSGLDLRWVDPAVRPQDDLFAHLNGVYLREHEIPADRAQDGAFRDLRDRAEEDVRAIVEEAAHADGPDAQRDRRALRVVHGRRRASRRSGVAPLQPLLDEVAAAADRAALAAVLGRRQRQGRVSLFGTYVSTDAKNSSRYLVHLSQSGLGLPDESYYRDDAYAEIRTAYVAHLARLAELVGLDDPQGLAEQVMELETALAAASWDRVTNRDAEKTYTLMTLPALQTERARLRLGALARRAAGPGRRARRDRGAPAQLRRGGRRPVGRPPARAVEGVAGDPHRLGRAPTT